MSTFIEWLEGLNGKDSRVRAVLRRSLSFPPGEHPSAFPFVEPFISDGASEWNRQVHYLVAALWALHWREGRAGVAKKIGAPGPAPEIRG